MGGRGWRVCASGDGGGGGDGVGWWRGGGEQCPLRCVDVHSVSSSSAAKSATQIHDSLVIAV